MKPYELKHDDVIADKDRKKLMLEAKRTPKDKLFEKITPTIGISTLVLAVVLSIFAPSVATLYILAIFVFFLYKSLSTAILFGVGLVRLRNGSVIDWNKKLENLSNIRESIETLKKDRESLKTYTFENFLSNEDSIYKELEENQSLMAANESLPDFLQKLVFRFEKFKVDRFLKKQINELENIVKFRNIPSPSDIEHVVMIPHVKEPINLLRETLINIKNQTYNTKQITIVLASESADPNGIETSEKLKTEFEDSFKNIWITKHELQLYDVIGKSANMNWAGRVAHKLLKEKGVDLKKVLLTSCDSDSKFDHQYFAMVSYHYLIQKKREYKIYSGAMVYYNNIWRVPFFARVQNSFYSIANVVLLARPDRYIPVSTYTLSLWLIENIGFWSPAVVPEDYHIFFKSIYKFDKDVSTVSMPIKILSDAAEGEGTVGSIQNSYSQFRRWSWGVSDHSWMLQNIFTGFWSRSIRSIYITFHVIFDHSVLPFIAIIIIIGGNLPNLFNPNFINEPSGALLPGIVSTIVNFTLLFFLIAVLLNLYLRPTAPKERPWWKMPFAILEWLVFPITGVIFSTLPAIDAQTRLMFQQYMEHIVTVKKDSEGNVSKAIKNEKNEE